MQKQIGLRTKAYLLIIPLVVVVVLLSGTTASMASRAALTRHATRHLSYKAEQLRDFSQSEWDVLADLGLDEYAEYRETAERSFRTYATSLIRSPTERIIAVDTNGRIVMNLGPRKEIPPDTTVEVEPGWFENVILDEPLVGVAFKLDFFGWTVAVTESQDTFFADIRDIRNTHLLILSVAVIVVTILISIFVRYISGPVERLTIMTQDITESNDLSRRVNVEFSDEVGVLAHEFNTMIDSLEANYKKLQHAVTNEKIARRTALEREEETLLLLGRAAEFRDQDTGDHLVRVGTLCALLSRLLGEDKEHQELIRRGSPLHDIGKIGIPDSILLKPGRLTRHEFEEMKKHTIIGYNLLKDSASQYLIIGARIALTHHEKWDGSGYPNGLSGNNIPLVGRIASLVDVFDALTSARPYKDAWSPERAHDHIVSEREKHFDPQLVDLFQNHFSSFCAGIAR